MLANKRASELSAKAQSISRCPLCLDTITAKSAFVDSFLMNRTINRCADCALKMLSFSDEAGSTATSK
jgi:hypothetical protein